MPTPRLPYKLTELSPDLNNIFSLWANNNNVPYSPDYDMRGFFLGGLLGDPAAKTEVNAADGRMHFSDKWKLPNHPSFSNESKYSTEPDDPRWVQPAPYADGTWAQESHKGLLNLEIPKYARGLR